VNGDDDLEFFTGAIPGPQTAARVPILRTYESHNVTYLSDDFPIFWDSASGATVVDVDGNRYIDLTAAFGVANAGHANPRVAAAVADQAARLMHGMGDIHPTAVRARLLERLAHVLPPGLSKTFLATTGSEAVEAALKTAILSTGRSRFAAYHGAYHGLSFGALAVCGIEKFRAPFADALARDALLLEYPAGGATAGDAIAQTRTILRGHEDIAAIVIEPIQGRAGCIVPPPGYLAAVRSLCDELGILMIVDEIFTGFGRTGTWFAVDRESVIPDILCIGKALGSGFPIAAAVGRPDVMDAWPVSNGEALHTSTYLGNPMGCAAALATIDELESRQLPERAAALEPLVGARLRALASRHAAVAGVRGRGLFWGLQLNGPAAAEATVKQALRGGVILLQSGTAGDVVTIAPPLVISDRQLERAFEILEAALDAVE
jgi:4-aminobutyrate aminotransferase/(S)-3-amino-2-methylpropionate transaminase